MLEFNVKSWENWKKLIKIKIDLTNLIGNSVNEAMHFLRNYFIQMNLRTRHANHSFTAMPFAIISSIYKVRSEASLLCPIVDLVKYSCSREKDKVYWSRKSVHNEVSVSHDTADHITHELCSFQLVHTLTNLWCKKRDAIWLAKRKFHYKKFKQ